MPLFILPLGEHFTFTHNMWYCLFLYTFYIGVIHQSYLYEISHSTFSELVLEHYKLKPQCILLNYFSLATSKCWFFPCLLYVERIVHTLFFPLHLFSLCSLSCCLHSFGCVEFSLGTVLLILTTTMKGSRWCLTSSVLRASFV